METDPDDPNAVIVSGPATTDDLDSDQQIIDGQFARKAMADWFNSYANIRQMHAPGLLPAGKGVSLTEQNGAQVISARIVEPNAVKLCREGVYGAFSVGIAHPLIRRNDPKAPNGRIVGGEIVEVSLVDRPANASCKFMLAKGAGMEIADVGETVEVAKADEPVSEPVQPREDEDDAYKAAYSDDERTAMAKEGDALPDGSYPIANKADLQNAISSFGRAKDPAKVRAHIIQRAKALKMTDMLPADWPGSTNPKKASKSAKPTEDFSAKRLHDLYCPAYALEAIGDEYPSIQKNGIAASLGPLAMQSIYQMLANEVSEDGGMGACAGDIDHVASAYYKLACFLTSELAEDGDAPDFQAGSAMYSAREELHKVFRKENDLKKADSPKPVDTPTPGQYKRPYLAAGRQRENSPSIESNSIPMPRVINAGDFDRGLITTGHEANSPANKAGRTFYTNDAKGQTLDALQSVHDSLAAMYPDMCPMGHTVSEQSAAAPATASMQMGDGNVPKTVTPAEQAAATMTAKAAKKARKADMKKRIEEGITRVEKALTDKYEARIGELSDQVNKLAGQPDPNAAAFRGGGSTDVIQKAMEAEAQKRASDEPTDDDRLSFLRRVEASGVTARHAALDKELSTTNA